MGERHRAYRSILTLEKQVSYFKAPPAEPSASSQNFKVFSDLNRQHLPQPLHHLISGRADRRILQRQIQNLVEALMVGVRVLGAGLGAVLVNGAVVVAAEEGAGRFVEDVVAFLSKGELWSQAVV